MSLMSFARLINSDGTHYLYLDYCTYFHTVYVYNSNITYDSFMVILAQNLQLIFKKKEIKAMIICITKLFNVFLQHETSQLDMALY